ncbi:hypothetical protein [Legionella septentrionalis]|uniref:hypothetical protein n=1 Tax=Legionella septentrionalis TaxID=2498109 RepID=UPI000F8D5C55|nr:hypothetical protein [Legionella septentrionalis]RUQ97837.1 hypothetical protein ELY11_06215 [Legionella septentrionalis]RUR11242.1 hypothetical protein ELY14_02565 [Legionella septentrionalis]
MVMQEKIEDTLNLNEGLQDKLLSSLREMKKGVAFTGVVRKKKSSLLVTLLKKVTPVAGDLAGSANDTGTAVTQLLQIGGVFAHSAKEAKILSNGFHYGSLVLSALDFIRVPALYLASWIAGEKSQVTLSKNARWLYSGVLLGLAIAAAVFPTAAVPIAIASASLGLGVSIFLAARFVYKKIELHFNIKAAKSRLQVEEEKFIDIQNQAAQKEQELLGKLPEERIQALSLEIESLQKDYTKQKKIVQGLHNKVATLEQQQQAKGIGAFTDKLVGVGVGSLALLGITLSLFFPTVGVSILAASAGLGGLYLLGRITYTVGRALIPWVITQAKSLQQRLQGLIAADAEPKASLKNSEPLQATVTKDSTLVMLGKLSPTAAVAQTEDSLQLFREHEEWYEDDSDEEDKEGNNIDAIDKETVEEDDVVESVEGRNDDEEGIIQKTTL